MGTDLDQSPSPKQSESAIAPILAQLNPSQGLASLLCLEVEGPGRIDPTWGWEPGAKVWRLPQSIESLAREEAAALLELAKLPATEQGLVNWLSELVLVTAGRIGVDEAMARIHAIGRLLIDDQFPAQLVNRRSLLTLAKAHQWLPSFAEITDTLAPDRQLLAETIRRLNHLAKPPSAKPTAMAQAIATPGTTISEPLPSAFGNAYREPAHLRSLPKHH